MTGQLVSWLCCMSKPTRIVISCDPEHGKCEVLDFGTFQLLTCLAISASAELLVEHTERIMLPQLCYIVSYRITDVRSY